MKRILSEKEYQDLIRGNQQEVANLEFSISTKQNIIESIFDAVKTLPSKTKQQFFESFHSSLAERTKQTNIGTERRAD